jgi:amino acid adenylation domain-containing protein
MTTVHGLLSSSAERFPLKTAVIEPSASITYQDLERRASAIAAELVAAGVRPGDRVLLALQNSIELVASYFGILKTGAAVVPLQPGPRSDRLPKVLQDCSPAACIVDDSTWPIVERCGTVPRVVVARAASAPLQHESAVLRSPDRGVSPARHADVEWPDVAPGDLAAIVYTSGSTGAPRGVMLTHRNITANTRSIVEYLELTPADRMMVVLPFYYVYGLSLLHTHVAVGGSLVLDNRFAYPNAVLKAMREQAVTGFAGVPSTFAFLLHRSNVADTGFPALRYVTQAGGPMAPARIREWLRAVPGVPFYVMYGATEAAARLTYLPPPELLERPGSIGRAIPDVEVRVLREDGTVAAAGEVGELVARGPNISHGYWNLPEETRAAFGSHGYRTGDLGYADGDGFLYLVGRRSEMLKVGAHRVSPREIEEALHEHPAVHEAVVLGAPDDLLGEVAVAYVALRDGHAVAEREIVLFARERLPEHKVPARVVLVAAIPKTPTGKPDRRALHDTACASVS